MTLLPDPDGIYAQHAVYVYVNITAPIEQGLQRAFDKIEQLLLSDRPIEVGMATALTLARREAFPERLMLRRDGGRGDFGLVVTGRQQRRVTMPLAATGTVGDAVDDILAQLTVARALLS